MSPRRPLVFRGAEDQGRRRLAQALGLDGNVLVVIGSHDVVAERSFGNLPNVNIVEGGQLTAYDVLVSDWVVFTDETLPGEVSDAPEGTVVSCLASGRSGGRRGRRRGRRDWKPTRAARTDVAGEAEDADEDGDDEHAATDDEEEDK